MPPSPHPLSILPDRRGSMAVEFALLAPCLLVLLIGVTEVGRALWIGDTLQYAADQTSRYAMVNNGASDAALSAYALGQLPSLNTAHVAVAISRATVNGVAFVTVQTSYPFRVVAAIVPIAPITLSGSARTPLLD